MEPNNLKAYIVQERPFDWMCGQEPVLVYATSPKEAIKVGSKGLEYERYTELRARREPRADGWNIKPSEPKAIQMADSNCHLFRELGWHWEGDDSCESCGLHSMEDHFPICVDCFNCSDCGHYEDCEGKNNEIR